MIKMVKNETSCCATNNNNEHKMERNGLRLTKHLVTNYPMKWIAVMTNGTAGTCKNQWAAAGNLLVT